MSGSDAAPDDASRERAPLFGRRVVVTRAHDRAAVLAEQLRTLGADAIEVPTIAIADPADGGAALRAAAHRISEYDWLVVTSPNGAQRTMGAFVDARDLAGVRVAAIGPGTANALAEAKLVPDLIPPEYVAESLVAAIGGPPADGGRILVSQAEVARDVLAEGLSAAGWAVDVVAAYRTVSPEPTERHRERLAAADTVTFTSSSAVTNFVAAFGPDAVPDTVACIGPITAATAREHGLEVTVEAAVHTIDGLVDALLTHGAEA